MIKADEWYTLKENVRSGGINENQGRIFKSR